MQATGGVKAFFATVPGRATLVVVALLALVGSFLYLGPFLAIPTLLLFGLAIPIYLGWKRGRDLAILGLVVLIVAAPIATALDAQQIREPSPLADSATTVPYGNGGAVLQNAGVTPYVAASNSLFNFSVTVNPQYIPANGSAPLWLELFVSTCPGATGNSSPFCSPGYAFQSYNQTFPANVSSPFVSSFEVALGGPQIWWWQMATAYHANGNLTNLTWIFLDLQNGYNAIQGPVTGDYTSTYFLVLSPIYIDMFLYPGSVFFFALLVYLFIKSRKARANRDSAPPMMTSGAPTPPASPLSSAAGTPSPNERTCPNCQALVYPNEKNCWKCGKPLPTTPPGAAPPTSTPPSSP